MVALGVYMISYSDIDADFRSFAVFVLNCRCARSTVSHLCTILTIFKKRLNTFVTGKASVVRSLSQWRSYVAWCNFQNVIH